MGPSKLGPMNILLKGCGQGRSQDFWQGDPDRFL